MTPILALLMMVGAAPAGQIRGTIVDQGGFGLSNVCVRVLNANSNAIAGRASTDDTGSFRIEALPPVALPRTEIQ